MPSDPSLTIDTQLLFGIEAVEGTEEALVAADALLVRNVQTVIRAPAHEQGNVPGSLTDRGFIPGAAQVETSFEMDLRGSGAVGTAPDWFKPARTCGYRQATILQALIGPVAGGPFTHLEQVTNGSGASATVLFPTPDGSSRILFIDQAGGTFLNLETLTGQDSGATATLSADQSAAGHVLKPLKRCESGTLWSLEDPVKKSGRGTRGSMVIDLEDGSPGKVKFTMSSVQTAAPVIDAPQLTDVSYTDLNPPLFYETGAAFSGYVPLLSKVSLNMQNTVKIRKDAALAERGQISYLITKRGWTGSADIEMVSVAEFDGYGKWLAGQPETLAFAINSTPGNVIRVHLPRIPFKEPSNTDDEGQRMLTLPFPLTGKLNSVDNEVVIAAL